MSFSEILNILLGGGLAALVVALVTMRATVRKANADAEKAKADAETVHITNTENATRILVENIVKPLKLKKQIIKTAKIKTYKAKKLKRKKATFNLKARSLGKAKLTYKVTKYPKKAKKCMTVTKSGKVTLKKKAKKGTYKIRITAAKTSKYQKAVKYVTVKVK